MRYDEIPKFKNFSIDTNLAYGFVGYINLFMMQYRTKTSNATMVSAATCLD